MSAEAMRAERKKAAAVALSAWLGHTPVCALSFLVGLTATGCNSAETPNPLEAESLRTQAADAFEASQWARCLMLLDQAKAKDPKGDDTTAVKDMRRLAMRKLGLTDASRP
jgi:hypothetical protein